MPVVAETAQIHTPRLIQQVLMKFRDVFPDDLPLGLPKSRETDHSIDLEENAKIPAHRIYRLSPAEDAELHKQLTEYLAAGQIESARRPFGAGVLFARKKDGTLRLCIDYRASGKSRSRTSIHYRGLMSCWITWRNRAIFQIWTPSRGIIKYALRRSISQGRRFRRVTEAFSSA